MKLEKGDVVYAEKVDLLGIFDYSDGYSDYFIFNRIKEDDTCINEYSTQIGRINKNDLTLISKGDFA